jgi:hypothetical protein
MSGKIDKLGWKQKKKSAKYRLQKVNLDIQILESMLNGSSWEVRELELQK